MKKKTTHKKRIVDLKRIEGQLKGIQRMISEEQYCIDIINQLHAAINGLFSVTEKIFERHIEHCVADAIKGQSEKMRVEKINEVMETVRKFRKLR